MSNPLFDLEMSNGYTFNPYFDWVSIYHWPHDIPPKSTKSREKNREFERIIRGINSMPLGNPIRPNWPFTGRLLILLVFAGNEEFVRKCDVDNLSKGVLDALKGMVFGDDSQIDVLISLKRPIILNFLPCSVCVGLKQLSDGEIPNPLPAMFVKKAEGVETQTVAGDETSLTVQLGDPPNHEVKVIKGPITKEKLDELRKWQDEAQIRHSAKRKIGS